MSIFSINCTTVNELKGSLSIKSSDWLKCENTTINPKIIKTRFFQYSFTLTQYHKKIKNHAEPVTRNKPLIDLYNWNGINVLMSSN